MELNKAKITTNLNSIKTMSDCACSELTYGDCACSSV
jgi:hypothetical protein